MGQHWSLVIQNMCYTYIKLSGQQNIYANVNVVNVRTTYLLFFYVPSLARRPYLHGKASTSAGHQKDGLPCPVHSTPCHEISWFQGMVKL